MKISDHEMKEMTPDFEVHHEIKKIDVTIPDKQDSLDPEVNKIVQVEILTESQQADTSYAEQIEKMRIAARQALSAQRIEEDASV